MGTNSREEIRKKLEEAAELVSTHLGDADQEWEIQERLYSNRQKQWVLVFKVEYEEEDE